MSKALTVGAVWDLFRGLNASAALIALIFVASGVFNTWGTLNEGGRR